MSPIGVNGVEIICKSIIMADCVAGVGRFLPYIDLGRCLKSRYIMEWRMERQAPFLKEKRLTRSEST